MSDPPHRPDPVDLPFDREAHPMIRAVRYTSVGLEFAVTVGLFTWLGLKGDARFGTDPWLTVVGSLIGIAAGMVLLLRPFLGSKTTGKGEDEA